MIAISAPASIDRSSLRIPRSSTRSINGSPPPQPIRQRLFRRAVAIGFAREFEPHDVVRTAFVQLILARGADQIVRRRDDACRLPGQLPVVHQRAKRLDPLAEPAHFNAAAIWLSEIAPTRTIFHPLELTATTVLGAGAVN